MSSKQGSIHTIMVQMVLGMLVWSIVYTSGHHHVKDALIQSQVSTSGELLK